MITKKIKDAVEKEITDYGSSRLQKFVSDHGPYVIKFVSSKWADHYSAHNQLKISDTPAQTWGTATYVTPLAFPLSSALYGRIGLVATYDPVGWRIFDATKPSARIAYIRWVAAQPAYADLILTVHSIYANHVLRNQFREYFKIDCVLFNPDQEAESHTKLLEHVWLAVTDWDTASKTIQTNFSSRLTQARFTVLLDEDFLLQDQGLPVRIAKRQIEKVTEVMHTSFPNSPVGVTHARLDPLLPNKISKIYKTGGYLHVYIEP